MSVLQRQTRRPGKKSAPGGGGGTNLFKLDFNTMTLSGPSNFTGSPFGHTANNPWSAGITVVPDFTGSGRGSLARYDFATNGTTQTDDNKALTPSFPTVTRTLGQSLWFQGDVYIDPAGRMDASGNNMVQRKLVRLKGTCGLNTLECELTAFGSQLVLVLQPQQDFQITLGTGFLWYGPNLLTVGSWHTIKIQMQINSAFGASDGIVRVWWDSNLAFERTDMRWSQASWTDDPSTYIWNDLAWGYQVNGNLAISEYRLWDNPSFAVDEAGL